LAKAEGTKQVTAANVANANARPTLIAISNWAVAPNFRIPPEAVVAASPFFLGTIGHIESHDCNMIEH
jgi:hypothetical protein